MKSISFYQSGRMLACALLAVAALEFSPDTYAQSAVTRTTPALPHRPNIILIVADGLGCGDLSCYGQKKFQTPNFDRLAAEGVRFTDYYAGNAVSSPARAALMLGRDSAHLKQRTDVEVPLAADEITVAQALRKSGYHTGLIGGWNLGGDGTSGAPWNKGFDEFAGYLDSADAENDYADYVWRYAPKSILNETNNQLKDFIGREMIYANTQGKNQYIPDLLAQAALGFIKNNQPDQFNHFRPFFLLLNCTIPGAGNRPAPTDAPFSNEPWPPLARNKAALISQLDGYVGQILEQLQKTRQDSNTVVFFTSDTGPQTNSAFDLKFFQSTGPFGGSRGELAEGGLRVPMIVYWPGKIRGGRVSDFPWAAWDFLPTAVDIALIKPPVGIDGISVLPAIFGRTQTNRHEFFRWQLSGRELAQAARMGDWKMARSKAGEKWRLYNLKADPGETNNVASANPEVIKKFESGLKW